MSQFLSSLALLPVFLLVAQSSGAGTITSEYALNPGSVITFEAFGDFNVTGGTLKVSYNAVGPQTPDNNSTSGSLQSAMLSFTGSQSGKIILDPANAPVAASAVSGSVGFVSLRFRGWNLAGTIGGSDLTGTMSYFTLTANLPATSLGTFGLYLFCTGNPLNTIYQSIDDLSGNEISRTFVPEPGSGLLLALGVLALPAISAGFRRMRH